jgi:hypothetical protein
MRKKQLELPIGHRELILLVDDEASIRAITRVTPVAMFTPIGFSPTSGQSRAPIICDFGLPD